MARQPLTWLLQKIFAEAASAAPDPPHSPSRRKFLQRTLSAAGSVLAGSALLPAFPDIHDPIHHPSHHPAPETCIIVGAGMAGLNAAWQLKKRGVTATIYDAAGRAGGRMYSWQNIFGAGISTDIGGEFVDAAHTDILRLADEFGLELYDLRKDTLAPKTFWFEGRMLGEEDLRKAIQPYVQRLMEDIRSLPAIIAHTTAGQFRHLDRQSITEYMGSIGIGGWLFRFLDTVLTREYGMEASAQSAINFLIMFDPPRPKEADYELFGQDHEIFKIKGGSQRLTDKLYDALQGQVLLNHRLLAIRPNPEKGVDLHFKREGTYLTVRADQVILAIPFSILRSVAFELPMPPGKEDCIREMGYGNSCKFIMGMEGHPWRKAGRQGYCFTDLSFGCGWDSSQMQSEEFGSFTVFGGGRLADEIKAGRQASLAGKFIPSLDAIYPGAAKAFTNNIVKFCWADNPYSKAGYSSFKKGQWSTLAGWEAVPVGPVRFAGEHVSREFQGYMNGAAQTGRLAAEAVLASLLATKHQQAKRIV